MILYTRLLWFAAGFAPSPSLILIHPKYRDDLPLLEHEKVHQAQQRKHGWLGFWRRYLFDRDCRQAMEVEAYKVQIAHGAKHYACARNLTTMYRLNISYETAYALLA